MSRLYCMITIADRSRVNEYLKLFDEHNVPIGLVTRGEGTANSEMEELFGLESAENEKAVCFSIIRETIWKSVKKDLETRVSTQEPWSGRPFVNAPWTGVSFIVPLSSVGGPRELAYLTRGMEFKKGEILQLEGGKTARVVSKLGEGGQGYLRAETSGLQSDHPSVLSIPECVCNEPRTGCNHQHATGRQTDFRQEEVRKDQHRNQPKTCSIHIQPIQQS